jgi:hypothetical protein
VRIYEIGDAVDELFRAFFTSVDQPLNDDFCARTNTWHACVPSKHFRARSNGGLHNDLLPLRRFFVVHGDDA